MKKSSIRSFFAIAFVLTSLSSYIYINTIATQQTGFSNTKLEKPAIEAKSDDMDQQEQSILPEVELVKKIIETGKRILPATGTGSI